MKTRYLVLALLISVVGCKKMAVAADSVVVPAKAAIHLSSSVQP